MLKNNKFTKTILGAFLVFGATVPNIGYAQAFQKEFNDVGMGSSYHESVMSLASRGIISGYSNGMFQPMEDVTRGQAAKLIAEALNLDMTNVENPNYKDVSTTHRFYKHIAALAELGILDGYLNGNFGVNDHLQRGQMAKILSLAYEFGEKNLTSNAFTDVDKDAFYAKYLQSLIDNKITFGKTVTQFAPSEFVDRGQLAMFIFRSDTIKFGKYVSSSFIDFKDDKLITELGNFDVSSDLKTFFRTNNNALSNAKFDLRVTNGQVIAVENLDLYAEGTNTSPVVFDGGSAIVRGDVRVHGDYLEVKNLVVNGDLFITEDVETSFKGVAIKVNGTTVLSDAPVNTAAIFEKSSIIFENAILNVIQLSKKDAKVSFEGNTIVQEIELIKNSIISAVSTAKLNQVKISGSVSEVVLNALIPFLEMNSTIPIIVGGTGSITNVTVIGKEKVFLETTGPIGKLVLPANATIELGSSTRVENMEIPNGVDIKDVIPNYETVKNNIDNVNGTKNPNATPPVVTPPPSTGGGGNNNGGGNSGQTAVTVNGLAVTNGHTVEVVMTPIDRVSFTWNGVTPTSVLPHDGTKYVLTVPADSMKLSNTLIASANGYSAGTKTFAITENIANLKVIEEISDLDEAITNQENEQTWLLKDGVFNHGRFDIKVAEQSGWYFPITANNLTIIGESKEGTIITSDDKSENGSWASQDHISVWGEKVTIKNLTIKPKITTNKTIEVMGKDFTLSNVNFEQRSDQTEEFAGSLYFNPQNEAKDIGTVLVENVLINDAWISAGDVVKTGTLTLKNTTIDFRGSAYATAYGGYGVISKNEVIKVAESSSFTVLADNSVVSLQKQILDRVPSGTTVELDAGNYYVTEELKVPTDVHLEVEKNKAVVEVIAKGTQLVKNVSEFKAALSGDATTIRMAPGTYELDSQIRIDRAVQIIGVKGLTKITKGDNAWTNSTGSKGYAPVITILSGDKSVKLENLIVSGATNIAMTAPGSGTDYGSGINVVSSSDVTLKNVISKDNAAAGLIVNSSIVSAENLNTSGNGWYGVNVDKKDSGDASFSLTGDGVIGEDIQIISDKTIGVTVNANGYTTYKLEETTKTIWNNKVLKNIASITTGNSTKYFPTIQGAISNANVGATINVETGTYELTSQLVITKPVTIKGIGEVIIKPAKNYVGTSNVDKNLLAINGVNGNVILENLTITGSLRTGINVWESEKVSLKDVTSKNNTAAGMVVNNSAVIADNFNTSGNGWGYGVNVDNGSNPSEGAPKTSFTLNSGTIDGDKHIVSDKGGVTIVAPLYKVLVKDADKVSGATITSWYGTQNEFLDTSVNINFDKISISEIESITFSLYNDNIFLGKRSSTGKNLIALFTDAAQYWDDAVVYTEIESTRTLSSAFMNRTEQTDNGFWESSISTATNEYVPNGLVIEVKIGNVTYIARK